MKRVGGKSTAKSDAALLEIRQGLAKKYPLRLPLSAKWNAKVKANLAKRERAKFKTFWFTVMRLGDVDLRKAARRVGVSKELLEKWMNTPVISGFINRSLSVARRRRARRVVEWAKFHFKMGPFTLRAPLTADDEIHPDGMDYGDLLPLAKQAALVFNYPKSFRGYVELALMMHEGGGLSSAKQFFIDLGKCLSHGTRGTRGINPELWDKLDLDIADIILSHDPPISDEDAVRELERLRHGEMSVENLQVSVERFGTRKHRLIRDAHAVCTVLWSNKLSALPVTADCD